VTLLLAAVLLYWHGGSGADMDNVDTQKHITKQDVEKMVSGLAAKLAQCPNDLKGWAMLARPYKVLGRPEDAEQAYERAAELLIRFLLNDALAMTSDAHISGLAQVTVEVRISKSGQVKAKIGDLMSAMQQVKVGRENLKFIVDQIRP